MLSWVVTFLVIALIAGVLGFGGVAGVSIEIAKAIFFIAVVVEVATSTRYPRSLRKSISGCRACRSGSAMRTRPR